MEMSKAKRITMGLAAAALLIGTGAACAQGPAVAAGPNYKPQTRAYSIAAVPLLVHEESTTFDWLKPAFAKKGLLDGKEVWGFSLSHITVYQGDNVDVTIVNPGDDPHTFTISDLGVNTAIKGNGQAHTSFIAEKVGTFRYYCTIAEHYPYMSGEITVLPASAGA